MRSPKKLFVLFMLTCIVCIGMAATHINQRPRNLKVLPKDITDQQLDSVMQSYNVALSVNCRFCHLPSKWDPTTLDYALDGEPMKEEARRMITMTIDINKKNFWYNKKHRPEFLTTVHCNTCHRGEAFPEH